MLKLVCANQRGGVAKTTTTVCIARALADRGMKVLLIDLDSQGSISAILRLQPQYHLFELLIKEYALEQCVVKAHDLIDVLCSDRRTQQAEDVISSQKFREVFFEQVFSQYEKNYEVILIDVAPSITLFQTCAMVYTRQVLIPVGMETLSVQGASAAIQAAASLNDFFKREPPIRTVGLLPVMVDRRLQMTDTVLKTLEQMAAKTGIPLLSPIRTDQSVPKAARNRQFLADFDKNAKALEDYTRATEELLRLLNIEAHVTAQA